LGFGLLVLLLLAFEVVRTMPEAWLVTPTVTLLLVTQVTAPVLGLFIAPQTVWQRICALVLALLNLALAMSVIAFSGGFTSLLWPIITVPLIALLLLMPGPAGIGTALAIWCAYGSFAFMMPHSAQLEALTAWLLHGGVVGLFVLLLEQSIHVQHTMRRRAKIREHVLRDFLYASNRLRATTRVQTIIEEVAMTAQSVGDFDCVTLSQVHWGEGCAHVSVAIGSSGQRLLDIEGRAVPWSEFAAILEAGQFAGGQARVCDSLPFRSIRDETHLVLPLFSQFDEVQGVLTVSASRRNRRALREALPLLELLANQSVALIDNATLYSTMGQRVEAATAELEQGTEELRRARDRAEVLYRISRALAATLDERQVLDRTLALVAQFTRADRGGIMLVEPHTGWLVFRTTLDCRRAGAVRGLERGRGLAGWVLAKREAVIVPDTSRDSRWEKLNAYDTHVHSVLAAPLLLESEALGVLILIHSDINHFNADHLQLVQAAANQSAVALSKAQLYRYVSEQSERLGVTAQQREMEASKTMAILRSIGDGVIVGDRLGRVRLINPAAEHILGITAEAFLGRPLADLPGAPQDKDGDADRLQQFVIGERTVRAHFAPVMSAKDEWLGSVVVYHDITREEMADRLKSELVATASHELRTPLTSMRGYVDMLMLDTFGPLNPSQRDFLRIVKNNVTRLVHLVDELLDMSRVEAGEVRLRREEVDLVEMFYETSQSLHGQFNERNVTLHMDLQDNLPVVLADRQRLQQILINLVGNACKYTEPGGQVDIALYNGGDKLRVDVRDTGVGIPEDAKPHIFTPFYRAENPLRDEVGGTGLGLSITRKLVEMHGGEIWFESAEGKGSTFSFTLPLSSYQSTAQ
jgi:signal transduction histidine kinase